MHHGPKRGEYIKTRVLSDEEILNLYSSGAKVSDIVTKAKCSTKYIYELIHISNITLRVPARTIENAFSDEEVIKFYLDGMPIREIVRKTRKSNKSIYDILRRNNIKLRSVSRPMPDKLIIEMYLAGEPIKSLRKQAHRHWEYISKLLNKNNVPCRRC